MQLIDTHTHLYLIEFDSDRIEMMQRCRNQGVDKLLLPNIDSTSIEAMFEMKDKFPDQVELMMGLHPCSVNENYPFEMDRVEKELSERKFVGVGEIGLDLYWDKSNIDSQKIVFDKQLHWSIDLDIPVSIHSREATKLAIESVKKYNSKVKGVFHCFSGSVEEAQEIIDLGMYLGIGGVVTYKNTNLPEIIRSIGLKGIVLETDSPYLSPVPYRGKRNESSYLNVIVSRISEILECRAEEVAEFTSRNAKLIFSI